MAHQDSKEGDVQTDASHPFNKKSHTVLGNYEFTFRWSDSDTFSINAKNNKTKREFHESIDKKYLTAIQLHQPSANIIKMIEKSIALTSSSNDSNGKNGNQATLTSKLSCMIGYVASKTEVKDVKSQMVDEYDSKENNCLVLIICLNEEWFTAQYPFILKEKQRSETDIIQDIMHDMQDSIQILTKKVESLENENQMLKQIVSSKGPVLSVWKSTKKDSLYYQWDKEGIHLCPKHMMSVQNNGKEVKIGISGVYRILFRCNWNKSDYTTCSGNTHEIQLNGRIICQAKNKDSGFVSLEEILRLKSNDVITFKYSCVHDYDSKGNILIIEKLCD